MDITSIRTKNLNININLVAAYRRSTERITKRNWEELLEYDHKGLESIVAGDFNAHNTVWNCHNTDVHEENLFEVMNNNEFIYCNQETQSKFVDVRQNPSNIDLIFSTSQLADEIEDSDPHSGGQTTFQ